MVKIKSLLGDDNEKEYFTNGFYDPLSWIDQ